MGITSAASISARGVPGCSCSEELSSNCNGLLRRSLRSSRKYAFVRFPTHVQNYPASIAATASKPNVDGTITKTGTAIEAKNLYLSLNTDRGQVPILKDCSITIPEGQFWMLLGPNGCGKSTLLKCLAGLMRPNRGHVYVSQPKSFVFQNPDHQVVMPTAEADVAFGLGRFDLTEKEVQERVVRSLDAVGMENYLQRPIQTLSGGQKQRVAIAGALAEASKVLLLDELTTFLDENDQIGVLDAVRKVVGGPRVVTSLWVTHRLEELSYADGAVYMEDGRVVLCGAARDIKEYIEMKKRNR